MRTHFGLMMIDQSRLGGSGAKRRHGFSGQQGSSSVLPARPGGTKKTLAAPPKRPRLGQERPEINETAINNIRTKIDVAVESLQDELESLKAEMDLVTDQALRDLPSGYTEIPLIGLEFTPKEIRTQIIVTARQIETIATRMRDGSAKAYLTSSQKGALDTVVQDARDLVAFADQFDREEVAAAHARLAEEFLDMHVGGIKALLGDIEKDIVEAEGSLVPVREPMEKEGETIGVLVGISIVVLAGLWLFDVI